MKIVKTYTIFSMFDVEAYLNSHASNPFLCQMENLNVAIHSVFTNSLLLALSLKRRNSILDVKRSDLRTSKPEKELCSWAYLVTRSWSTSYSYCRIRATPFCQWSAYKGRSLTVPESTSKSS